MSGFPSFLRRPLPPKGAATSAPILQKYRLHTVCEEAKCPNRMECYAKRTATFLTLGPACTRNCAFCSVAYAKKPPLPEADEPERIGRAAKELNLAHVVITMVTRDDLLDEGAGHIASTIRAVRRENPQSTVEVLTSDFSGHREFLDLVLQEKPEIFNHNIETVRSLSHRVRHKADYDRSLSLIRHAKESSKVVYVKSGIMLGLGETDLEIRETIQDLAAIHCDIITIGQYLQPCKGKWPVHGFILPERYSEYEQYGLSLGVRQMICGPFVRSDYNAHFEAK